MLLKRLLTHSQTSQKKTEVIALTNVKNSPISPVTTQKNTATGIEFPSIPTDSPLSTEASQINNTNSAPSQQHYPLLKAENPRGSVFLLNSCQTDRQHTALIQHLYKALVGKGWNTQILQAIPNTDIVSTINKSAQLIKEQSSQPIALLAHGCDDKSMLTYATQNTPTSISAYIILSPASDITNEKQNIAFSAPLLNIRGGKETLTSASDNSPWLKAIETSGGESMELATADRYFSEQEESLVLFISNWLR